MVKILVALVGAKFTEILEVAGAAAVVYGMSLVATSAAWITVGLALLLKSLEVDLRRDDGDKP